MMVADLVARQQSNSPINGETPSLNSTMPRDHMEQRDRDRERDRSSDSMSMHGHPNGGFLNGHDMGPMSPLSPNSDSYELSQHLKRKELFSQRKQREFIPDNKKDDSYWDRRRRNNEAAKRSREKRRFNDMILEQRVVELTKENHVLKAQLDAIKEKFGICGDAIISVDQVIATLPTNEQVLNITKRPKLSNGNGPPMLFSQNSNPLPPSVVHPNMVGPSLKSPSPHLVYPSAVADHMNGSYPQHNDDTSPQHFAAYRFPLLPAQFDMNSNSALNLSRTRSRSRSRSRAQSPYEISSGSGDECSAPVNQLEPNNSLPLKLRHKSHLGDKDAANALLALQNIKQEPNSRASPPWDAEGSSDERDSGISLGAECMHLQKRLNSEDTDPENKVHLESELARLASEVATLKSLLIQNKTQKAIGAILSSSNSTNANQ
ncbi:nuclear factor interleukin-3-regulated protein isoform X2 [Chrysoperla carnea]|nr:nuclear factor interleukin-3-regulated protein isoform X2 [Chrysoperla carnea]XP_044741613.1 nuclear factor interleukin-3-regulated protein isoform X2 [Chrysoperla carnea]